MLEIGLRYGWNLPDECLRFKRYLTLICLIFACICLILAWDMFEIFLGYTWDFFIFAWDMIEKHLRYALDLPRYVRDIPDLYKICEIYAWDLTKLSDIWQRVTKIMTGIFLNYAYHLTEIYLKGVDKKKSYCQAQLQLVRINLK